ncbi:hypothetical protein [Sulfurimonas sp.]|uniref:hypothetical protein n=1 Tax=Sulfurimonas sp. TaxID=2022749 RepID=UPI002AAF1C64|nr:hypothetical protein [Sulfurimonas sp.]
MKIVIVCLLLVSIFHANEIQRIESIVDDISKLRIDYEKCKQRLSDNKHIRPDLVKYKINEEQVQKYKKLLKESKQKNIILKAELDYISSASSGNTQSIKKYKKLLKLKDKEIKDLKNKLKNSKISNKTTKKTLQICKVKKDDNPFPKLMPKGNIIIVENKIVAKKEQIISFKASSFRLKKNSAIYISPNSKKIDDWEKHRTFTSNLGTKSWIKVTGYFINKKWIRAKDAMWIKKTDVYKRK